MPPALPIEVWRQIARHVQAPIPDLKSVHYAPPEGRLSQNDLVAMMQVSIVVNAAVAPILYANPVVYDLSTFFYDRDRHYSSSDGLAVTTLHAASQPDGPSRWSSETKTQLLGYVKQLFLENDRFIPTHHSRAVSGDAPVIISKYAGGGRFEEWYVYDEVRALKLGVARGLGILGRTRSGDSAHHVFRALHTICIGAYAPFFDGSSVESLLSEMNTPLNRAGEALTRAFRLDREASGTDTQHDFAALLCGMPCQAIYVRRADGPLALPRDINIPIIAAMLTCDEACNADDILAFRSPIWVFCVDWTDSVRNDQFRTHVWGAAAQLHVTVSARAWERPSDLEDLAAISARIASTAVCFNMKDGAQDQLARWERSVAARGWDGDSNLDISAFTLSITAVQPATPISTDELNECLLMEGEKGEFYRAIRNAWEAAGVSSAEATATTIAEGTGVATEDRDVGGMMCYLREESYHAHVIATFAAMQETIDTIKNDADAQGEDWLDYVRYHCRSILDDEVEEGPLDTTVSTSRRIIRDSTYADTLYAAEEAADAVSDSE